LLKTEHRQWVNAVRELAGELSQTEQIKLFSANAIRDYNLNVESI
jgi:predicted TIM-barrel fold metal-dependent hydrolase